MLLGGGTYWISTLVLAGLLTNAAWLLIKIRVNQRLPDQERFSYWKRDYSSVARKYRELYPDSRLPAIARSIFAIFLILFGVLVVRAVLLSQ